ncbi:MAG: aldolase/citrate lyase family protein [Vicinamibacterales bacterium]
MKPSPSNRPALTGGDLRAIAAGLRRANAALARACPGDPGDRQPIQTYYTGAQFFHAALAPELGAQALATLEQYAPDAAAFARALDLKPVEGDPIAFAKAIRSRVVEKLRREPVEDLRIDFEDGYGNRPDAEEDGDARSAAEEVARGAAAGTLPPFIGIRIKPLSQELQARSLRTLDLFVSTLARATGKQLVPHLFITIPKVMMPGHVTAVARACDRLERRLGVRRGTVKLEIMIETPQSILAVDGSSALRALVAAGGGRVSGAHFGTYDYTALCGITAAWQHLRHAACDFAKHLMQVSLAQSGVRLSDGSTNVLPVGSPEAVHRAWQQHAGDVTHSLINGFYQGWDLHPAQLPTRYAAVFAFYASARPAATARLRKFVENASQATLAGDVFDDAATGQALLNFFARGLSSGALTLDEALETGLTRDDFHAKSFLKILESRRL